MIDPVELGKQMAAIVREATSPLVERIAELEKALSDSPAPAAPEIDVGAIAKAAAELIPAPKDGADADMEALKSHLEDLVKAIPAPKDGESVTVDDVAPLIQSEVEKAVSKIPAPKDGKSITVDDVKPVLANLVSEAVKEIPAPKDGVDGKDADMAELKLHVHELVNNIRLPAPPSVDEVAAVFERRFSDLTLSWERQARDTFEKAADRMPVPKDGRDALPLDSFDMELAEDGRTLTLKMQAGDTVMEKSLRIATVLDRGPFRGEEKYERGDAVTHGGSLWIAQVDGPEGAPGLGGKGWRLAVKKGRDGKDLRDNASSADTSKGVSVK